MFNLWLLVDSVPLVLKSSRTSLIPKLPNPAQPKDYRPISVSSHMVRCFNKILAARISEGCSIDGSQKAFVPVDGCQEHLAVLEAVLE
jgi:hypothetical protein